jgi:hypothetical protein
MERTENSHRLERLQNENRLALPMDQGRATANSDIAPACELRKGIS